MNISVIIPTYNEAENIEELVLFLQNVPNSDKIAEIIVVDAWSQDNTMFLAQRLGAKALKSEVRKRSLQMNMGARAAEGQILYFLHADTRPPQDFVSQIIEAVEKGYSAGCYRLEFDQKHWLLDFFCWFTQFDITLVRFGDQSLFVTAEVFDYAGAFDQDLVLLEDQELVNRLRRYGEFIVLPHTVVTSARKFRENGVVRLFWIYIKIYVLYFLGRPQSQLVQMYIKSIKGSKIGTTTTR